jgi:uncharacterized protein (DUF488 family)
MKLFTVGHSNHSIEEFIALLHHHGVTAVADVRSHPYSKYLPHFNQKLFQKSLLDAGIRYVFLGKELGARSNNPDCYVDGKAVYEKIASTKEFSHGIERILQGAKNYYISLMCAEKDPITCHRAVLVCQHLRNSGLDINHILKNGDLETHHNLEERLLELHHLKLPEQIQLSLFDDVLSSVPSITEYSKEESLKKAYQLQGDNIAYTEKTENQYEPIN